VDDYDVADLLNTMVAQCVELLDVAAAGLTLADVRGSQQVLASSEREVHISASATTWPAWKSG
jgi:hypothetical protein